MSESDIAYVWVIEIWSSVLEYYKPLIQRILNLTITALTHSFS